MKHTFSTLIKDPYVLVLILGIATLIGMVATYRF